MPNIETLKFWCHKLLPLVYDDSLSYYEVLCKVSAKLNEVIGTTNEFGEHLNEQLLEMRELINTELARIESEVDTKMNEAKTAIKEELTSPNSFNGSAIINGSIADNKLMSKLWHFFNRVPVSQYTDLDDIMNVDNTENIVRLTVSVLGELNGVIGAGDYICVTNTNNTAMVLLNTDTGVSWTYEKGSNNINAVANIAMGSITGGVGGKIKAHTITDSNIASGTLTGRVFADGVLTDRVKFVNVRYGFSKSNIDDALVDGGEKALYYMFTSPDGDLTPNEQVSMWGYAVNKARIGEEDTYVVVFTDYKGRTWEYSQRDNTFVETNNVCKILFTVDDIILYAKNLKKDSLVYAEIPIGIIGIGYYICTRDHDIITLRCVSDGVGATYTCNANTKEIAKISTFDYVGVVSSLDELLSRNNVNTVYLFRATGGLPSTVGDGVNMWMPNGSTATLYASNGKVYIYNLNTNKYTLYTTPLNTSVYAPTRVYNTSLSTLAS